jgi:transmembrane sensor
MTDRDDDILPRDAADWHAQILSGAVDWDAFARWLDADDAHQAAYDRIAMLDDEVTEWVKEHDAATTNAPANDDAPVVVHRLTRRWWAAGTAIAAVAVAAISLPLIMKTAPAPTVYYTAELGQKTVQIRDGSSARLDRGTKLALEDGGRGRIRIESGAAYFDVRHDPAHPFVVQSGDYVIRDIGTRFAVARRGGQVSVAVAEGQVDISWRGAAATALKAGRIFEASGDSPDAEIRSIDPETVASWRNGKLVYDNTPLGVVAADVSRYTSMPIIVDPTVAGLKLSGILLIEDGSHLVDQIQAILPVEARREGDHIRLVRLPSRR